MRSSDYAVAAATAAAGPAGFMLLERLAPSLASPAALRSSMRLMGAIGLTAGFLRAYNKSSRITSPSPPLLPSSDRKLTDEPRGGGGDSPLLGLGGKC